MAAFTCAQYFASRIPALATLLPGYDPTTSLNASMALYWDMGNFGATTASAPPNTIDEQYLTERQKVIVAMRTVLSLTPVVMSLMKAQVVDAQAGPALSKFEERSKVLKAMLPMWETELRHLEAAEGVFFDLLPNIPAYLLKVQSGAYDWFPKSNHVVISGTDFVDTRNL